MSADGPPNWAGPSVMTDPQPPWQTQHLGWLVGWYLKEADTTQALVQAAVDATEPALVFHGHWHQQNRCRLNNDTEVIGLGDYIDR